MDVPPIHHRIWTDMVTGKTEITFECFALRAVLGRILAVASTSSPERIARHAAELREMFLRNAHLPSLQRDLAKVLG